MAHRGRESRSNELGTSVADHAVLGSAPVRRVGQLRLPLTPSCRPWATLYILPSGDHVWLVRLWLIDRPVARGYSTELLLAYARASRLLDLERDLLRLEQAALTHDPVYP